MALFFVIASTNLYAQLRVSNTRPAVDLIQNVLADKGVVIKNITSSANITAIGFFNGTNSNIGLDSGIILSTGSIFTSVGPNTIGNTGSSNNQPGDTLINSLNPNDPNFDAAWIEFDVIPESDSLKFRYVFASEEYPENVNKNYNDVFGLFISGPGIPGIQNLAVLPDGITPISINTVNNITNSQYYIDNTSGSSVEFDGFTTVFEAKSKVIACQPYRLKLVIADVKDLIYDSGIFIEALSLKSISENGVSVSPLFKSASECDTNRIFIIRNSNDLSKDITVNFELTGTAIRNQDYTTNYPGNSATIPAGQKAIALEIYPNKDGIAEPTENIFIKITSPIICDTIVNAISLVDYKFVNKLEFKFACDDSTIRIFIKDYELLDSVFWRDKDSNLVSVLPALQIKSDDSNYYYIYAVEACTGKSIKDSVRVFRYSINTISDTIICFGDTLKLFATSNLPGAKFEWSSTTLGQFNPTPLSSTPFIIPQRNGKIKVKITNEGVCSEKEIDVKVIKLAVESNSVEVCGKEIVQLKASGGTKYKWVPSTYLNSDTIANPTCLPDSNISYQLFIENGKCSEVLNVNVTVNSMPNTRASEDVYVCSRQFVRLYASGSDSNDYEWFPVSGLDSPNSASPLANPIVTTTYIVKGSNGACFNFDTVTVFVVDSIGTAINYSFDSCNKTFIGQQILNDSVAEIMWDMGNGDTLFGPNIVYKYNTPGLYNINVISNPKAPCFSSSSVLLNYPIVDENERKIPNAFSPNNDGNNDVFRVYFGNTQCRIDKFQIYNRWGELVFDSERDKTFEWDGKYKGEVCAEGIYVYIIEGQNFSDKGWVALFR